MTGWRQRFLVRGVYWRQLLRFAVLNVPSWIEPIVIGFWSLFFLLWGPGRRGVMHNLKAIKPASTPVANFFRTYLVFWNFAWSITDTARFRETRTVPDWEFVGLEHFEQLRTGHGGAIILTAHMGSYDLGAHVFSETSTRRIVMVRAPEVDPETAEFEVAQQERARSESLRIDFNTKASELALELLHAIQNGDLVAIQGDRVTPGIATMPATLFGRTTQMPAGPFALAMASRAPLFPLFIMRAGRRRYRLITCAPIHVERRSRHRDDDLQSAIAQWSSQLEDVIRRAWYQWFAFEPYDEELAA
ncbi:MAG TPA: lysophospholipid acyltransferase family protein [Thermoanaerobaculia bacterium]